MRVISNSGPLISLSAIGQLELLPRLYGTIVIPRAVHDEVVINGAGEPGSAEVAGARWIVVEELVGNALLRKVLSSDLGYGEAAVLALVAPDDPCTVLIDDRKGRQAAIRMGIPCRGTLGILVEAKRQGLLHEVRSNIDRLASIDFRMSADVRRVILAAAGEDGPP